MSLLGAEDLDALEILLAPAVSLRAVQQGPSDCIGREQVMALLRRRRAVTTDAPVDPDGPEPFPHGTRITVATAS